VSSPFSIHCEIDYGAGSSIGRQAIALDITPASFLLQLAAARTFLLEQEAVWLRSQGLGGRVTCQDLLVFDEAGPIGNALRFADECARHKALDMVGDLTLAGCDLIGHFVAHCSGHRLNAELVAALLARAERNVPCRKSA
jgi:UDP-3-O-[3-hydroxymyristoyl] N-acetylglucosamine deacetylase/UDP-3-O-[3-hydroxymyristoyl] N-acetylglucosamine deacetylase/3-hydroxyacyl-[acyl-carrier-protein] dehydratase